MKHKLLYVALIVAMFVLAACGGQPTVVDDGTTNESQSSSSSSEVTSTSTVLLDPALATDAEAKEAIGHLYEGLVRLENGEPGLALAVGITLSEDNLGYIFELRPGVQFHDGTPLNADAVIVNFNRWFDTQDPLHGSGTYDAWLASFGGFKGETTSDGKPKSNFDGIEKVDDLTVLVHLNAPDADLLTKLSDPAFSIVSPAALNASGFGTPAGTDGGSGAYLIAAWEGSVLTLEPNPSYWDQSAVPTSSHEIDLGE
jgi:peptide/nickel transport system substrate-binding protein